MKFKFNLNFSNWSSNLRKQAGNVLWTQKAPTCLLTLLYAYGKPRLCINIHHHLSVTVNPFSYHQWALDLHPWHDVTNVYSEKLHKTHHRKRSQLSSEHIARPRVITFSRSILLLNIFFCNVKYTALANIIYYMKQYKQYTTSTNTRACTHTHTPP